jgi:hypothetical protein
LEERLAGRQFDTSLKEGRCSENFVHHGTFN